MGSEEKTSAINTEAEKPQETAEKLECNNESNDGNIPSQEAYSEPHDTVQTESDETMQDNQTVQRERRKNTLNFDEALKRFGFQSEFDRRVNKAIQSALDKARNSWEEQKNEEGKIPTEVEALESEISEMKKKLAIEENRSEAHEIAGHFRYKPSNDLIEYAVKEEKEKTISNTLILCQLFNDTMTTEIKKALSGQTPRASFGSVDTWTKEKILNEKDRETRLRLIAEHPQFFVGKRRF